MSAKIDCAFAFGLIDQEASTDLHAVREIRNQFAHARTLNHFGRAELKPVFQKLRGYKGNIDVKRLFDERVTNLTTILGSYIEKSIFAAALMGAAEPPISSEKD